jgi:hypothetical protein
LDKLGKKSVTYYLNGPKGDIKDDILPWESFVGKNHDSVISFASEGSTNALCRVAHRVESQKVVFANLKFNQLSRSNKGESPV